jgi:hypothetical protein
MEVIPTLLSRDDVDDFSDERIEKLAKESQGTREERENNRAKLEILVKCLGDIKGLQNYGCKYSTKHH